MSIFRRFASLALILLLTSCNLFGSKPELNISADEFSLNSDSRTGNFFIANTGASDSVLEWSISKSPANATWLNVLPTNGSLPPGPPARVDIFVDQRSLSQGQVVNATLTVHSNGGTHSIDIQFTRTTGGLDDCGTFTTSASLAHAPSASPQSLSGAYGDYVPGQLLVRYQEPVGTLSLEARRAHYLDVASAVQAEHPIEVAISGEGYGPDLVQVAPEQDLEALAASLESDPRVAYAEPNYYLYPLQLTPNDPLLDQQWNMTCSGLPQAWAIETGKDHITIAIIDSGVDMRHEDLVDKLLPGYDFYNGDDDPNPGPPNGHTEHGTHVAGIAAAAGNNGLGVAGVAYTGVKILPVRVFDETGRQTDVLTVANAIRWSAGFPVSGVNPNPNPARILNLSLGGPGENQTLNEAVANARAAGTIVVAASGNEGRDDRVLTPANAPGALAVGSVNSDYTRSNFSNYNLSGRTVDLMAPGGFILSGNTCPNNAVPSTFPNDGYGCLAGTSMSAPFVAGVAALIWSQNPSWSADQVIDRLRSTTYTPPGWDAREYGSGVVCADRALGATTLCGQ